MARIIRAGIVVVTCDAVKHAAGRGIARSRLAGIAVGAGSWSLSTFEWWWRGRIEFECPESALIGSGTTGDVGISAVRIGDAACGWWCGYAPAVGGLQWYDGEVQGHKGARELPPSLL